MVVANFGMALRPISSVIQTGQEQTSEYQRKQSERLANQAALEKNIQNQAMDMARKNVENTLSMGYHLTPEQQENLINRIAPSYIGEKNLSNHGAVPWFGASRDGIKMLNAQRGAHTEAAAASQAFSDAQNLFKQQQASQASAQKSQQDSYNAYQGGSIGGVLGRTSQAGMNDPTQPGATMPWNQPWSQAGYGNPGSLGGLGGYKPSAQQGWGSVFGGGRNPWSLA